MKNLVALFFRTELGSFLSLEENTFKQKYKNEGVLDKYVPNQHQTILINLTKALKLNSSLKGQTFQKALNIFFKKINISVYPK